MKPDSLPPVPDDVTYDRSQREEALARLPPVPEAFSLAKSLASWRGPLGMVMSFACIAGLYWGVVARPLHQSATNQVAKLNAEEEAARERLHIAERGLHSMQKAVADAESEVVSLKADLESARKRTASLVDRSGAFDAKAMADKLRSQELNQAQTEISRLSDTEKAVLVEALAKAMSGQKPGEVLHLWELAKLADPARVHDKSPNMGACLALLEAAHKKSRYSAENAVEITKKTDDPLLQASANIYLASALAKDGLVDAAKSAGDQASTLLSALSSPEAERLLAELNKMKADLAKPTMPTVNPEVLGIQSFVKETLAMEASGRIDSLLKRYAENIPFYGEADAPIESVRLEKVKILAGKAKAVGANALIEAKKTEGDTVTVLCTDPATGLSRWYRVQTSGPSHRIIGEAATEAELTLKSDLAVMKKATAQGGAKPRVQGIAGTQWRLIVKADVELLNTEVTLSPDGRVITTPRRLADGSLLQSDPRDSWRMQNGSMSLFLAPAINLEGRETRPGVIAGLGRYRNSIQLMWQMTRVR
ncbi:MAG: hypothetical protein JNJ83_13530 [Verrucomicrobiaceae bacterium]|nr:hypothetical protein [Verrucomicrobiaceae bacterium]